MGRSRKLSIGIFVCTIMAFGQGYAQQVTPRTTLEQFEKLEAKALAETIKSFLEENKNLKAGEVLDGEGGYTVWGKLYPAKTSTSIGGLPIGLASHVTLKRDIAINQPVLWQDVDIDKTQEAVKLRLEMESSLAL